MKHSPSRFRSLPLLLASIPLLAVLCASPARAGINRFTPYGPGGGTVQALAVDPATPGTVYALTDTLVPNVRGEVYKSTDGGATWKWSSAGLPALPFTAQALALDPAQPGTLYTSIGPYFFRSTDGAAHWTFEVGWALTDVFRYATLAVAPDSTVVFTYGPHVLRLDRGATWTSVFHAPQEIRALLLDPAPPHPLYLGTVAGGGTWRITDRGASFSRVEGLEEVTAFAAAPTSGLLYAASAGRIYASTDGGALWTPRGELSEVNVLAVDPASLSTLFAARRGGIWASRDGGATWRAARGFPPGSYPYLYPTSVRALAADPARPGELYAGAAYLGVYKSSNSGRVWRVAETQRGLAAGSAWGPWIHPAVPSTVYMVGEAGFLWRSTDGGQSWEKRSDVLFDLLALDPFDPEVLYGVHIYNSPIRAKYLGYFSRSTDGGATWQGGNLIGESLIWDVAAGKGTLLALGTGSLYRSTDGGRHWGVVLAHNGIYGWLMTDPANAATFYLGSAVGGPVYRSRDKGLTWQRLLGDAGSLAVAPSRPATLYAVTLGKTVNRLQRSTNGGRRWTEVGPIPLDITKVVVDQEVPTTLYAATPGRGVWRSTDGGVNWTWVSASLTRVGRTGINSLTAHPVAPHTFYVTTSPGGLFEARFED